jgi:nicotinamide riboside kinase
MKIGITGTNNTGKTTLSYNLVGILRAAGHKAEISHESVRCCPLGTKKEASVKSQIWILGNQIKSEEELTANEDIVICDKTAIDTFCYGLWAFQKNPNMLNKSKLKCLKSLAVIWAKTYNVIIYLPPVKSISYNKWHNNIDHRVVLDNYILEFLHENNIEYYKVSEDFNLRNEEVLNKIEKMPFI